MKDRSCYSGRWHGKGKKREMNFLGNLLIKRSGAKAKINGKENATDGKMRVDCGEKRPYKVVKNATLRGIITETTKAKEPDRLKDCGMW
jgi:hypothetical protein